MRLIAFALAAASILPAVQITFTGGTLTRHNGSTAVTNNSLLSNDVDHYEENGFRLHFVIAGTSASSSYIGDYYGAGNDVVHGHWETGGIGRLTMIKVTKLDGSAFDLNYFVLTSNTERGGGLATGSEQAYIHASLDGVTSSHSQLLPSENWGFPATQVYLGADFDNIKAFWFVADNPVACFGMDNFYINEPAPEAMPEPGTLAIAGVALVGWFAGSVGAGAPSPDETYL